MDMVDRIELILKQKNMTMRELETKVGVSSGTIQRYRRSVPGVDKIMKVAKALDVRAGQILDEYDGEANLQLNDRESNLVQMFRELDFEGKNKVEGKAIEEMHRVRLEGDNHKAAQ